MNHVKEYVKKSGITHFLTYADNYAIGYFEKQGFTKHVTLAPKRWKGYIKDYDGGTLMECVIHSKMNYLEVKDVIRRQKEFIYEKIRRFSRVGEVQKGYEVGRRAKAKAKSERKEDILKIPGVQGCGWGGSTPSLVSRMCIQQQDSSLHTQLLRCFDQIKMHSASWPFHDPVDTDIYEDYSDFVSEPIDLGLIKRRLDSENYYTTVDKFKRDLCLMCSNCRAFNGESSKYGATATTLEEYCMSLLGKIED